MAQRTYHDSTGCHYTERYGSYREGWRRNQLARKELPLKELIIARHDTD
jgi:hypothetical protein